MSFETLDLMAETGKWRAREMRYFKGSWQRVAEQLPSFELRPFKAGPDEPENPFLRSVVRLPIGKAERPIPVGVVSPTYTLAPHRAVLEKCVAGLLAAGVETDLLVAEIGLSELDEWMHLRIPLPEEYDFEPVPGDYMQLQLECTNSVNGASRLGIQMRWLRLICSNGMTVERSLVSVRDIHNEGMNLERIPKAIASAFEQVQEDRKRLRRLTSTPVALMELIPWVNGPLTDAWGPQAAARVLHISRYGSDAEPGPGGSRGKASSWDMASTRQVPGSPAPARNIFDISQALAWVASHRNNAEERIDWQRQVSQLIQDIPKAS